MRATIVSLLVLLAALSVSAPAAAETAFDHLVPRLDRQTFGEIVDRLELQTEQRLIAELAFNDYVAALATLADEIDAKAEERGRGRLEDALAGRGRLSPAELRTIQVGLLTVYRQAWPRSDALLWGLLESIEGLLTEEQRPRVGRVMIDARRHVWLVPRREGQRLPEYAGDGLDVIELAEDALRDGGPLAGLDRASLQPLLDEHALRVDAVLAEVAVADRRGAIDRRVARIERDEAAQRRLEREAVGRWQRFYQVNQETVSAIGRIAAARLGEQARVRWQRRFRQESFPWIFREARPDRLHAWMRGQPLTPEQQRQADAVYQAYRQRRDELANDVIGMVLEGRLQLGLLVHPASTAAELPGSPGSELHARLLKRSGERQVLIESTARELETLLTPAQRREAP